MNMSMTTVADTSSSSAHVDSLQTRPSEALSARNAGQFHSNALHLAADLAPLPRTTEFHAGNVLESGAMPPAPKQEREESYIPVALARTQLRKVVADMHAMKAEQVEKLNEILEHYHKIEKDTEERHEARVRALKERAEAKLKESRQQYSELEKAGALREEWHAKEKQALVDEQERQRLLHLQAHEAWRIERERALQAHEDDFVREQTAAFNEIARVSRAAAFTGEQAQQQLRSELQMSCEDAHGQAMRIYEQLHSARVSVETQNRSFLDREAKLRRHFLANLEAERLVYTLIDTVVDRKQQLAEADRTQELQMKLRHLEAKAEAAGYRERTLGCQLEAARKRFDFIQAQAVQETVELLVHAVVVTIEGQSRNCLHVTAEASIQTQDSEEMLGKSTAKSIDVGAVETSAMSVDRIKRESEVEDAHEYNRIFVRSKAALHDAKTKLETLERGKKTAKRALKTWLAAFEEQYGRMPTIEEKAQVKDKFLACEAAEMEFNAQQAHVLALKQQHRELGLGIATSNHWSALGSTATKSARTDCDDVASVSQESSQSTSPTSSRFLSSSVSTKDIGIEAVVATRDSGTDAGATDDVIALENELHELRTQLATVKASYEPMEHGDTSSVDEMSTLTKLANHRVSSPRLKSSTDEFAVDVNGSRPDQTEAVNAVDLKRNEEAKARDAEHDDQLQQQRQSLVEEIAIILREIEERRAEKTQLEAKIEQLRLYLELSEEHDSDLLPSSEEKSHAARMEDIDGNDATEGLEAKGLEEFDQEQDDNYDDEEFEAVTAESKDEEIESVEQDVDDEPEELEEDEEQEVKEDAARSLHLIQMIGDAVARGKAQFNRGDKAKCYQTYAKCTEKCITELLTLHDKQQRQEVAMLKRVLAEAARLPLTRSPQTLRKQLDGVRANCEQWLYTREEQARARLAERNARKEVKAAAAAARKQQSLEKQKKIIDQKDEEKKHHKKKTAVPPPSSSPASTSAGSGSKVLEETKQRLRALEAKARADRSKISQLEAALGKAEMQLANGGGGGNGNNVAALDRRVVDMEKKHKKALEDREKGVKKELMALTQQLQAAQKASQELQEQTRALQKELDVAGGKAKELGQLEVEVSQLREQTAQITPLNTELREVKAQYATLETSYREEQALRKKYYNQIEDMKGKIRVYARCRPMSSSESERGCATCVKFIDEFSLEVNGGNRATKTFAYDQVFPPASTQVQVFEDTQNLLQSAIDGYNVCIFAYGQTGSGKTFTMTGCEDDPGLSPRAIHHLFALAEDVRANFSVTFHATMLELYNDTLIDLFHLVEGRGTHDNKLEIKKNEKGMVVVQNATLKKCSSPEQTLRLFEAANKKRQVGATKMNAESSRSHSIFSLLVESYNKTTKATTIGKLSLVDLAGSERAGKTGATAERLKEAQAINKSLSALGDVISALSTNEKFIPYRNNKLTQLMQDSLGGNAKTLMFVNISPADYNQEETVTSLTYASRVKLITNNANKNSESEQVSRLKGIIKQLRAGKTDIDIDGVLD